MKKRIHLKIFLTFLLVPLLFSYWTSWNEETNYVLTKSIVEEGSFHLEKYRNVTGDLKCDEEGRCYADIRRWGLATLSTSIYFILNLFTKDEQILKYLLTLLTSGLFFSLSSLVAYKLAAKLIKQERKRIFIVFVYGFSTSLFQQARFFTNHSLETFLLLSSLYLFTEISKGKGNFKKSVLFGILLGIGLLFTTFFYGFILLFTFLLFFYDKKNSIISFLTAVIVYSAFHTSYFFLEPRFYPIPIGLPSSLNRPYFPKEWKAEIFLPSVFLQILIFPSKGLLFYYPVLFFALIGLLLKGGRENISFFIFIILAILANSTILNWWFGWVSYGPPRVLAVLTPLFFVGLIHFIKKFGTKLLIPFVLISVINNFLLLQYGEDKISTLRWEEYKSKLMRFQILSNPLFEHYLPLTLKNGPRSVLLENLILSRKIDINLRHPCNPTTPLFSFDSPTMKRSEIRLFSVFPFGILVFRLKFLSLFVFIFLLVIVWGKQISKLMKVEEKAIILSLFIVFFTFSLRIKENVLGDGWYAQDCDYYGRCEEGRWMERYGELFIFSKTDESKIIRLNVENFVEKGVLDVYLNEKRIGSYEITKSCEIVQQVKLRKGENILRLVSRNGCIKPITLGIACDERCLSFKLKFKV